MDLFVATDKDSDHWSLFLVFAAAYWGIFFHLSQTR